MRQRIAAALHREPPGDTAAMRSGVRGDLPAQLRPRNRGTRAASVLVGLVEHGHDWHVLLTQRTDHLPDHPGQISFPGGSAEAGDPDAVATALRESEEEIGLSPERVEIAGFLDTYLTVTGFRVTPVVGFVRPGFVLRPDPFEVAEVFELPLSFVLDRSNRRLEYHTFRGREIAYYVIPYGDWRIWGATAAMLVDLSEKLAVLE